VEGTLGPRGGYRLARPPAEIDFLEIVEAVEGNGSTFVCTQIRKNNPCRPEGYCETKSCAVARVMWEADQAWRNTLRGAKLSDLVETLSQDIPAQIWEDTFEWALART
jgi:Rrf2 family protein